MEPRLEDSRSVSVIAAFEHHRTRPYLAEFNADVAAIELERNVSVCEMASPAV